MKESRFITRPIDLFYLRPVESQVLSHLGNSGRILDLGCGNGAKAESFRRLGFEAWGIDIDPARIKSAQEAFPDCNFVCASMESLPFPRNSFDAVFSSSTLQYVGHKLAIAEVNRILKPHGKAVFLENLSRCPLAICYRFMHRLKPYSPHMTPKGHLDLEAIGELFRPFQSCEITPYNLTTTALIPFLIAHQILARSQTIALEPTCLYSALTWCDKHLLNQFPPLRKRCWTVMIRAEREL